MGREWGRLSSALKRRREVGGGAGERWVGFEATAPCGAWREQGDRPAERHATGAAARQGILQGGGFGMGRRRWHMGRGWLSGR
jgi:hypothetical protein